ncbi:MAG: NifB/NifX family molybdenum-iron cluster-binding protein [Desulfobacteraceae bacterium]
MPIWENKISPVLDTASRLLVLDIEDQSEAARLEIYFDEHDLSRRRFRIQALGVDILICGAVSRPFLRMLTASGVSVIPGISGHAEDVIRGCLQGNLSQSRFLMPGFKRNGLRQNIQSLDLKKSLKKRPRVKGEDHGKQSEA